MEPSLHHMPLHHSLPLRGKNVPAVARDASCRARRAELLSSAAAPHRRAQGRVGYWGLAFASCLLICKLPTRYAMVLAS